MSSTHVIKSVAVERTVRVKQMEGIFDVSPAERSMEEWSVDLPLSEKDWKIGLIVGPSGSGKTSIARELWPSEYAEDYNWPDNQSILDGFPENLGIQEIVGMLNSVGFSSPTCWVRPFRVLSTGQQFRVKIARALLEGKDLVVIDEFTSVVDRTVAQIGSAAVANYIRKKANGKRLVALSCHSDIMDWLQPDWTYHPHMEKFTWRCLQRRPSIPIRIYRVDRNAWKLFKHHHYLSGDLSSFAKCFVGVWNNNPVCFMAIIFQPNRKRDKMYRGHRTVVFPDFQGVGIGNRMIEEIARMVLGEGARYVATTSHPAIIAHRKNSKLWRCTSPPRPSTGYQGRTKGAITGLHGTHAIGRMTSSWEFVGP